MTDRPGESFTTATVAAILGVSPPNLRRWVREGKFSGLPALEWDRRTGFQKQRIYSKDWVEEAASLLGVIPDWDKAAG